MGFNSGLKGLNQFCISTSKDHRIVLYKVGKEKTKILVAVGNFTWLSIDRPFAAVTMDDLKIFSFLLYQFTRYALLTLSHKT